MEVPVSDPFAPVEIDPHDRPLLEKIGRLRVLAWSTVMPDAAARSGGCRLDGFELAAATGASSTTASPSPRPG